MQNHKNPRESRTIRFTRSCAKPSEVVYILNGSISLCEDAITATKNADAIILVTEWPEFRLPDWETILNNMNEHVIFDGRNIYNPEEMKEKGFVYYGIGIR